MRLVQLGTTLAVAMTICGPAAADVVVFNGVEMVRENGVVQGPFYMQLARGQSYELAVTLPGSTGSVTGYLDFSYDRDRWNEDGSFDWNGSNNFHDIRPLVFTQVGNVLTTAFTAEQNSWVFWPNFVTKQRIVGEDHLSWDASVDPALFGQEVAWTLSAVPEPTTWALMLSGFGLAGWALRRSGPSLLRRPT